MGYFFRALISYLLVLVGATFGLKLVMGDQAAFVLAYLLSVIAFLWGIGGAASFMDWVKNDNHHASMPGWKKYFQFDLDHKVVGIQYLVITLVIFVVALTMATIMRIELAQPGMQIVSGDDYNTVMGTHGISMVVVTLIAILGGMGNYFVPLMIGAEDMAFPRLNALSFWLIPPAVLLLLSAPAFGGHNFGWTAYPPLSTQGPLGRSFFVMAFITVGFSSIFGSVNFVTTVLAMRRKGMTMFDIPIFVWSVLSASCISLLATSVVAGSLILVVFDRAVGTSFFNPLQGGNVLLYQHLFWFYSHPAVYIVILPAFGALLQVLSTFSGKEVYAYKLTAISFIGIVVVSFIVWAHHMFTSGMWNLLSMPFMITTELISIPTSVVFLSALGTLWGGNLRFKVPMLFALGMVFNFLIGGLTGIFLADVATDLHFHDTYFVTAHFHYTLFGGAMFGFFAAVYYWFPRMTGKMLNEKLGRIHFWLIICGFHLTFLPMFWLGARGMRRRVWDYPAEFGPVQLWVSCMAILIITAVIIFLINLIRSWTSGQKAEKNPWGAKTLEWN